MEGGYRIVVTSLDRLVARRVRRQGRLSRYFLRLLGIDVPPSVKVGEGLRMPHSTNGLVLHPNTVVGDRVTLWHHVTVGRGDVWLPPERGGGVTIEDDAILGAGSRVLFKNGQRLTIERGAVVGANAVVTGDIPAWEIWAGIPARKVGERPHH